MTLSQDDILRIVREFRRELKAVYGARLKGVYLYGSYARNEADEDSDIDLAVVLADPVNRAEERRRTSKLRAEMSLRENCVLMPFFLSETELRTACYAIHRSILRDGIPV